MEIRGNTKYVAIGVIVDDTKEVTVDDNTLGYIITGVKILDLESSCVIRIISLGLLGRLFQYMI